MKTFKKELGREYISVNEDIIIDGMVTEMEVQMEKMYSNNKMLRQIHTKMHGCVKASFVIEPGLPENLKIGVFVKEKTFHAWVRFSNSKTKPAKDKAKDIRGIAIKLLGVEGDKILNELAHLKTQDFLLMSSETFFSKSLAEFSKTMKAFTSGSMLKLILYVLNPMHWRILAAAKKANVACEHPAGIPYWSTQPYQFGSPDTAVKYFLKPDSKDELIISNLSDHDYLKVNLAQTLFDRELKFDFCVQFQADPDSMPIEDPTIPWDSQFHKLATLLIHPQIFDLNHQLEQAENMSFNAWHSLTVHRPLGSFNRARRRAYHAMSQFRHQFNHIPVQEPEDSAEFLKDKLPAVQGIIDNPIPKNKWLTTSAEVIVSCDKATAFDYIDSNENLPGWLRAKAMVKGASMVDVLKGPYDHPDAERKVIFTDGSSIIEQLLTYRPYVSYSYTVSKFTNFFRHLTDKAYGQIWLDTVNDNTRIRWVYTFTAKNFLASIFIGIFMRMSYKKFMQYGLDNARINIENGNFSELPVS